MHFTPELISAPYYVRHYEPGCIKINQDVFNQSIIIVNNRLISWEVPDFSALTSGTLDTLLAYQADVILLGTGEKQHFLSPSLLRYIAQKGVAIDVMSSHAAASTYNLLAQESRSPLLALMIH